MNMSKFGPIQSVMTELPATPTHSADSSVITNGVPGYPKGTGGNIDEVTFDTGGQFGKVQTNQKG